ncbi:hypothetical protein Pyn_10322 [Prunus yedoensis var. nudiflora]|uniref:Uncharacterized protein n=1 Tax=Prunus yedoensis var. nudiflora TaxID=2094558 RepID=A0A314UF64_PRUYE|nr:hypothetical protein Pyn_10322 [Prunus yedoensis var. nudiflora]
MAKGQLRSKSFLVWLPKFARLIRMGSLDCKSDHLILSFLGMFQIDIILFDCFPWMDLVTCMKTSGGFGPTFAGQAWTFEDLDLTSGETMWLPESLILIEHNPSMLGDLEF